MTVIDRAACLQRSSVSSSGCLAWLSSLMSMDCMVLTLSTTSKKASFEQRTSLAPVPQQLMGSCLARPYLVGILGINGLVDVGGVAAELLQHFAGFQPMHACQPIIGGAEHVAGVPREGHRGDPLPVCLLKAPYTLPRANLPDLGADSILSCHCCREGLASQAMEPYSNPGTGPTSWCIHVAGKCQTSALTLYLLPSPGLYVHGYIWYQDMTACSWQKAFAAFLML